MTAHDDDLVPDDLADLFAAERKRPELERPAEGAEAHLWSRIVASTGPFPGGGGGNNGDSGGGDGGASRHGDGPVPVTTGPPAAAAAGGIAVSQAWLGTTAAKLALSAAIFVAGGATGVAVDRAVTEPRVVTVTVEAAAPRQAEPAAAVPEAAPPPLEASPSASVTPSEPPRPVAASGSAVSVPSAMPSSPHGADRDADLDAERSLLERARTALGRGDASGAVEALGQHAARFPRGRLGEEREALWIQALIASGRVDEARTRFERFRARHPSSLLVPAMEAALQR